MIKPIIDFIDGPCEFCTEWENSKKENFPSHVCASCKEVLPVYDGMEGRGFRSLSPHHFHVQPAGKESIYAELCLKCHEDEVAKLTPVFVG